MMLNKNLLNVVCSETMGEVCSSGTGEDCEDCSDCSLDEDCSETSSVRFLHLHHTSTKLSPTMNITGSPSPSPSASPRFHCSREMKVRAKSYM